MSKRRETPANERLLSTTALVRWSGASPPMPTTREERQRIVDKKIRERQQWLRGQLKAKERR
jgi:hypothetical protein